MDYTIREGNYEKLGVQKKDDAVIFTFEGEKEELQHSFLWKKSRTCLQNFSAKGILPGIRAFCGCNRQDMEKFKI